MTYKIITDNSSDMNVEFFKNSNIVTIPMQSSMGDKIYEITGDKIDLLNSFYEHMIEGNSVSTSQVNLKAFESCFEDILKDGKDVLYLGISDKLSGTFQNAQTAKENLKDKYKDRRIEICNPRQASTGGGLMMEILEKKQKDGQSLDELLEFIKENSKFLASQFGVDSLKYLYKGGRISKTQAGIGDFLRVKPLIHIDDEGALAILKLERGNKKALKTLISNFRDNWRDDISNKVLIGYAYYDENAKKLKELLEQEFPNAEIKLAPIGSLIGSHVGPGMYSISYFAKKR
ncbi:DegV family protein [Anaerococcus sp. AGMB00486]|uniref:DegV family protein n=2 Tax=Anaerococcus TaxID=165779 RepID=A0ABX2N854_9FIRM|nr:MULTISPECIES: DegV family protein [Anaerococcus]MSS77330.1 DegV family protein [Anaerococcus porci]NVF10868.1 DegV family protein [Anaerococcus faecalis]